jgi:hypothetical protein
MGAGVKEKGTWVGKQKNTNVNTDLKLSAHTFVFIIRKIYF